MPTSRKRERVVVHDYVDAAKHFDVIMEALRHEIDGLATLQAERFRELSAKLDKLGAHQSVAPQVVVVQHEKCETDHEKGRRYAGKISSFLGRTELRRDTNYFLNGVLEHIEAHHFISERQCAAVDRIIGEHYA